MDAGLKAPGGRIKALFPEPLWASWKKHRRGADATIDEGTSPGGSAAQPISAAKAGIGAKPPKSAKPEVTCEAAPAAASTKQ